MHIVFIAINLLAVVYDQTNGIPYLQNANGTNSHLILP